MKPAPVARLACALSLSAACVLPAIAQSKTLTPEQRHQVADLQRRIALGAAAKPAHAVTDADATAPKLTKFNALTTVNANLSFAQLEVDVTATDGDSGVNYIYVYAISPSGSVSAAVGYSTGYPSSKVSPKLGIGFNRYSEPGTWTIYEADVYDAAGNVHTYDTAQLAALGNTTFTVQNNSWARDTTPPVTTTGSVLTPDVALTDGTNLTSPWTGTQLHVTDSGAPKASGIDYAATEYCTLDLQHCFAMGWSSTLAGQASLTVKPGTQVSGASLPAGVYYLYYVYVVDWAGNAQYLTGAEFGGETDFSTLFPAGHTMNLHF